MQHLFSETPGHDSYPIESIIGTLGGVSDRMFDHIAWQLKNLHNLGHPKAVEVGAMFRKYGYGYHDTNIFLSHIPAIRYELALMSQTIRTQIQNTVRQKVSSFLMPTDSPETHDAAA